MRIGSLVTTTSLALIGAALASTIALSTVSHALADDDSTTNPPAPQPGAGTTSVMDESQNNRQKTLQGSKSPFSLQFQLQYNGSSIIHPLAQEVPNAGHLVPAPTANLTGTFSGRYRLDPQTTVGLGGGITTYTPFQGPSNTSVANPYTDIAHSFKIGDIRNRADLQLQVFTDHLNNDDYGYTTSETILDEAFYEFKFGLTVGFLVEFDYYTFSGKPQYQPNYYNSNPLVGTSGTQIGQEGPGQIKWDLATDPYFEYALNSTFNLRSVIGWVGNNFRSMPGNFDLDHSPVYQTLGLGTQAGKSVFVYTFLEGFWNNLNARSTTFGFSTIINLF
jgi:hypothetical protein